MLGEKRSFLDTWQCLGKVHLRISNEDRVCPAHWRGKATQSFAAARTSGVVRSDDAEKLLAHPFHLAQTSLPANSFTTVGHYVLPFSLLVSSPSLPTYVCLFPLLVFSPSLPTYSFTSVGRRYVVLFSLLVSSPSLSAYPFTSLANFHDVYSQDRIT